jgi:hypothetical protein
MASRLYDSTGQAIKAVIVATIVYTVVVYGEPISVGFRSGLEWLEAIPTRDFNHKLNTVRCPNGDLGFRKQGFWHWETEMAICEQVHKFRFKDVR